MEPGVPFALLGCVQLLSVAAWVALAGAAVVGDEDAMKELRGWRQRENRDYLLKLGAAFAVTAVLGLLAKKLGFELPDTVTPIAWALILGGLVMLGAEQVAARRDASHGDMATNAAMVSALGINIQLTFAIAFVVLAAHFWRAAQLAHRVVHMRAECHAGVIAVEQWRKHALRQHDRSARYVPRFRGRGPSTR